MQSPVIATALLAVLGGFVAGLAGGRFGLRRLAARGPAPAGITAGSPVACVTILGSDAASLTGAGAGLGVSLRVCFVDEDARWYELASGGALRALRMATLPRPVVSALDAVRAEW